MCMSKYACRSVQHYRKANEVLKKGGVQVLHCGANPSSSDNHYGQLNKLRK